MINCWETPENTHSTEYLESILIYNINQARERKQALVNTDTLNEEISENDASDADM